MGAVIFWGGGEDDEDGEQAKVDDSFHLFLHPVSLSPFATDRRGPEKKGGKRRMP